MHYINGKNSRNFPYSVATQCQTVVSLRMAKLLGLLCFFGIFLPLYNCHQRYTEKYRLRVHYSIPSGWSNDPNGLIYNNGYYHLFYQHNPFATTLGPIHWGHARSADLIHWQDLPIAISPYEKGDIFSGCCLRDDKNLTGLLPADQPSEALIAIYTLHKDESQTQAMAYSLDKGLTWSQYSGNPIIPNEQLPDFRDPNVFERNGTFYMTLAVRDRIKFYASSDMLSWSELQDFGVAPEEGDKSGVWECPSLFSMKDDQGVEHDFLIVSENGDAQGSLLQYFIGKFNGTRFNTYDQSRVLWLENAFDNYAAIPYHNDPLGRVVLIGWLSNWLYAQQIPTSTWRGQMTIPRELQLKNIDGRIHVAQRPVAELDRIIDSSRTWCLSTPLQITGTQSLDLTAQMPFKTSMLSLHYEFDPQNGGSGKIGIRFANPAAEYVSFDYLIGQQLYEFDRRRSGDVSFNGRFGNVSRAHRIDKRPIISARIILDTASIEIFADNGLNTFSALFFPSEPFENIQIIGDLDDVESGKSVTVNKVCVEALTSIWNE